MPKLYESGTENKELYVRCRKGVQNPEHIVLDLVDASGAHVENILYISADGRLHRCDMTEKTATAGGIVLAQEGEDSDDNKNTIELAETK